MKQKTQTSTEEMFNQAHQGQKRTGVVVGMNLQRVPISEVAEVNPRLRSKPRQDELVSFVPMAAVSEKTVSIESPVDRPFAEVAKGFTPFERGDVIVAKITPCFENGKMAYAVDLPRAVGAGSTEFHVLRPKPSLNGAYLFHMLRLPAVRADGARKMQGAAGQRRVPAGFFASLQIPLPPLAEQKRIAAILDAADALRAKRREALAQLDALLQSTFLTLFGDPVENPMGWERKKFSEIGSLDRGVSKHRPRNAPELLGGPFPLVQTGEIANCDTFIRNYKYTYSEVGLKQSKLWPAGTLCITIAANIAKTGILAFEACFPDSVVGFRSKDPATVHFAQTWLSFLQKMLEETAPESAQKNINLEILRNLQVPLPPLPLQQKFAAIVESVERQKAAQRAHLAELDALFAALQHRAFRGQL
jgi:type I restriction enzyme S subunit